MFPVPLPRPAALDTVAHYRLKYIGVDMCLKALCYFVRMLQLYTKDAAASERYGRLIMSIIDARMLFNTWKYFGTAKLAAKAYRAFDAASAGKSLLTLASFSFRSCEQVAGDLGFVQKNWLTAEWDRYRIAWHYKMNKCGALACCAALEVLKIRAALAERRSSPATLDAGSLAASPCGTTPVVPQARRERKAEAELRRSYIFLVRNVCDLIVYMQWVPWYRPPKTLEFACGMASGAMGVYIVWVDAEADLQHRSLQ
jgi:hypothetical protein